MPDLLVTALRYREAGLSVIPIRADGTKAAALSSWTPFQHRLPSEDELRQWFGNGVKRGVAVVCGAVSGNLAVLDFDSEDAFTAFGDLVVEHGLQQLVSRLPCAKTPSGFHLYLRTPEPLATQVLAHAEDGSVLVEVRGEGAYAIVPPSPAEVHPDRKPYEWLTGDLCAVAPLTAEEVEDILSLARALNRKVEPAPQVLRVTGEAKRVGDIYNEQADVLSLLQRHGWQVYREGRDGNIYLTRPGKARGVSASWHEGLRTLYVFSTNAPPFVASRAYTPFAIYTLLEHGGDFSAAAKALAQEFGDTTSENPAPFDWSAFVHPLSENPAKSAEWLFTNLLARGEVTILAGESGAGKTTLALEIAHALTADDVALGEKPTAHARVLWLAFDHSANALHEKYLTAFGVAPNENLLVADLDQLDGAEMLQLTPETLRRWVALIQGVGAEVLIVDALRDWLAVDDSDKEAKVRPVMQALRQLAEQTNVAVLATHHPNKLSALRRVTSLANSYVFGAKADTVALLADPDGEPQADLAELRVVKCRSGERWSATYRKEFGRFSPVQGAERPKTLGEKLLALIAQQEPCPQKSLLSERTLQELGASERTVRRTLDALVRAGRAVKQKGGYQNLEVFYSTARVTFTTNTCDQIDHYDQIDQIDHIDHRSNQVELQFGQFGQFGHAANNNGGGAGETDGDTTTTKRKGVQEFSYGG